MPRPPRNKFNPLPTTAPPATGKTLSAIPTHVSSPRSTHTLSTSDDSDGLVTKNKTGANRRGIPRKDAFMGGALLEKPTEPRQRPLHGAERATLTKIARQADYEEKIAALKKRKEEAEARARAQPEILVPTSQEPPAPQPIHRESSRSPAKETQKKGRTAQAAPSTVEKPKQTAGAHRRAQATPSSVLSLAKFKRRPRESSILRIGPEDESLSLTSLGGGSDDSFGDLENVKPLHESTPLNRPRGHQPVAPLASGRATDVAGSTPTNPSSTSSRKRKITPPEILVSHSQSPTSTPHPPAAEQAAVEPDLAVDNLDQDEPTLPSPKRRALQPPEIWDETMAPPQSSSPTHTQDAPANPPSQESPVKAKKGASRAQGKQRGRSAKPAQSPTVTRPKKKAAPPKPMTTSALQNLLPRRRVVHHVRDEFDLESSDIELRPSSPVDEDADELSFLPSKKKRAAAKLSTVKKPKPKPVRDGTLKTPRTAQPAKALKSTAQGKRAQPLKSVVQGRAAQAKTYTRRASDKENGAYRAGSSTAIDTSSPGRGANAATETSTLDSSSMLDVSEKGHKKLRGLARKFREIDKWEMTFEEVTASSSSPRDAR